MRLIATILAISSSITASTLPAYVDKGDISEIEKSYPSVNLDLLRYLSDNLNNFFRPESSTTPDPRGLDFGQFVATGKCSNQAAWSCFNDIDTNNDGFVSKAELDEYDRTSMIRVKGMYDDYLETTFTEADNDNDGYVSYDEGVDYAENILRVYADDNWRQLFKEKDQDGDGRLDKDEFMSLVSSWYRGDNGLKYNDYAKTTLNPRDVSKRS
ncbi:hypothetical protein Q1695_009756 [Nippostrongylus brasiliensis]|nr:hypothetical protein Q1695_009756 [Nippostrongylus brasiliensis]